MDFQNTLIQIYSSVADNTPNADLGLALWHEAGYDLKDFLLDMPVDLKDGEEVNIPDPLNLYLCAVGSNNFAVASYLIRIGFDPYYSCPLPSEEILNNADEDSYELLTELVGLNDLFAAICGAHVQVVSGNPEQNALHKLLNVYDAHELDPFLNRKTNYGFLGIGDDLEAREHSALDFAVMKYVEWQKKIFHLSCQQAKENEGRVTLLEDTPLADAMKSANIHLGQVNMLLDNGAQGSVRAYFPDGEGGYQIMGLLSFCEQNKAFFNDYPQTLEAIKKSASLGAPSNSVMDGSLTP